MIHCISLRWAKKAGEGGGGGAWMGGSERGLEEGGAGQKVWRGKAGQAEARAGISSTLSLLLGRTSSPRAFLHSLLTPNPCWPYPSWPGRQMPTGQKGVGVTIIKVAGRQTQAA